MKNLIRLLMIFILLSGIIATSFTSVIADDDTTDDDEHDETKTDDKDENHEDEEDEYEHEEKQELEDVYKRELEIDFETKKLEITSKYKYEAEDGKEIEEKFEIEFEIDDEPEIEFEYKTESDSSEVKLKYKVEFEEIIEYLENGTTPGYQHGEELSSYELDDHDWSDMVEEIQGTGVDAIYIYNASTVDGVFTLIMKISASLFTLENNATLTPNSLKIDIVISDFPYTRDDTSLALKTKIKSKSEQEFESDTDEEESGFGDDESQIGLGANGTKGFFSWAEKALADSVEIDVLSSSLSDSSDEDGEDSKKMYFSFVTINANEIVWDPKVGIISDAVLSVVNAVKSKYSSLRAGGSDGLPGFGFWIALITLGISQIALIRLRRNKLE